MENAFLNGFQSELDKLAIAGKPLGRVLRKAQSTRKSPGGLRSSFAKTLGEERRILGKASARRQLPNMRETLARTTKGKYEA